ncbi:tectonic-1 [Cloeon dipterum]|uniref:tectonic-1 n=1 Tax=Cloeon dipterum TaxID=197152 RepID=UPI003220985E
MWPRATLLLLLGALSAGQNVTELDDEMVTNTTAEYYEDELAQNDTLLQTSTAADSEEVATTTANASTATPVTTAAPTTTTPPPLFFPQRLLADWYCTCDLQIGVCDIDCCCDRDCSKFDLSAFPRCQKSSDATNNEQCNTNGFLCIFKDNLPERNWLHSPKVALTLKEFDSLASRYQKQWSWRHPRFTPAKPQFEPVKRYMAGDLIWVTKDNSTLQPFVLPLLGRNCVGEKSVRFLREVSVRCVVGLRHPLATGAAFDALRLLGNVSAPVANQSAPWLPLRRFLCPVDGNESCVESGAATHAARVALHVHHNGTSGIAAAKLLLWPAKQHQGQLNTLLEFSVRFFWQGKTEAAAAPRRSGSPGYLPGRPVIAGVLNGEKTAVASLRPFLLASADESGACGAATALLFGEDAVRTCDLALNASADACPARTVLGTLAPGGGGAAALVAAFGDATIDAGLVDWLPVAVRERPSGADACGASPLSLGVDVLWAKVGAAHAPQNKLVGVALAFGAARPLAGAATVRLTTSVTFREVTAGLKGHFAPPPKYEIRLPNDFFYPLFGPAVAAAAPRWTLDFTLSVFSVTVWLVYFVQ